MNGSTFNWAISQTQIEQLVCASYEDIFDEVCTWNLEREFANDANDALRRFIIHTVVRRKHPSFNWPPAVSIKVRGYASEEDIEDEIGILVGPSDFILPWPMSSAEQTACRNESEVAALTNADQESRLSGKLIAEMVDEFVRNTLLPAHGGNPEAVARLQDPQEIKGALLNVGLELPDNLRFEAITDTLEYRIKHVPLEGEENFEWVFELPAPSQALLNEIPDNSFMTRFVDRCPIPCLE